MAKILKDLEFWIAISILIATILLMTLDHLRFIRLGSFIGPFRVNHWLVLIGSLYIALIVPIIAFLKNRYLGKFIVFFRIHIFGNLLAFLLISLHFVSHISRPEEMYEDLGTGFVLYIIMLLLVATGFTHRFRLIPKIKSQTRKFVHVGLSFSFYTIIGIHILHGLGFL